MTNGRPVSIRLPATQPHPFLPVSLKTAAVLFHLGTAACDVSRCVSMLRVIQQYWALSTGAAAAAAIAPVGSPDGKLVELNKQRGVYMWPSYIRAIVMDGEPESSSMPYVSTKRKID